MRFGHEWKLVCWPRVHLSIKAGLMKAGLMPYQLVTRHQTEQYLQVGSNQTGTILGGT